MKRFYFPSNPPWEPVGEVAHLARASIGARAGAARWFSSLRRWGLSVCFALVACGGVVEPLEQRGTPEPADAGPDASCPEWQRPDGYCLAHCAPGQRFNCWRNAEEP